MMSNRVLRWPANGQKLQRSMWLTALTLLGLPGLSKNGFGQDERPNQTSQPKLSNAETGKSDSSKSPGNDAEAARVADPRQISLTSMRELRVKLIDETGEPVAGALVMPYAMRMVEQRGHGFWDREVLGAPKEYESGKDGVATIRYPGKIFSLPKPNTTSLVTFQIRHTDFVKQVVHLELGPDYKNPLSETEVPLERGCELEVMAIDEMGEPIEEFAVMISGSTAPDLWEDMGEGKRRTSAFNPGTWQMMVVAPQTEGPPLFSGLRPIRVRPEQAVRVRGLRLRPGARLFGSLSADVPRPVKDGYIITTSAPRPAGESWGDDEPTLTWSDWTTVDQDGNFEIPSLPRGGEIQVIAVCDGWVSQTTLAEAGPFVKGQLFPMEAEDNQVTVAMERTGTLELEIVDTNGNPLGSGSVSSWPNQQYYKGGSTILGQRYRSLDIIQPQITGKEFEFKFSREGPFMRQPIVDGICTLRGLPIGKRDSLALEHDDYKFAAAAGDAPSFILEDDQPKKLKLVVVPHETTVPDLGQAAAAAMQAIKNLEKALKK